MRTLFKTGFLLFFLCGVCHAGVGVIPQYFYNTAISSVTNPDPLIINVSTSSIAPGATQMDNPQLASRVIIEIQNIDATANLWCSLGSTAPFVNGGRKIAAGNSWIVSFLDKIYPTTQTGSAFTVNFWCLSDGAAATKAAVTQIY